MAYILFILIFFTMPVMAEDGYYVAGGSVYKIQEVSADEELIQLKSLQGQYQTIVEQYTKMLAEVNEKIAEIESQSVTPIPRPDEPVVEENIDVDDSVYP